MPCAWRPARALHRPVVFSSEPFVVSDWKIPPNTPPCRSLQVYPSSTLIFLRNPPKGPRSNNQSLDSDNLSLFRPTLEHYSNKLQNLSNSPKMILTYSRTKTPYPRPSNHSQTRAIWSLILMKTLSHQSRIYTQFPAKMSHSLSNLSL